MPEALPRKQANKPMKLTGLRAAAEARGVEQLAHEPRTLTTFAEVAMARSLNYGAAMVINSPQDDTLLDAETIR